MKLRNLFDIFLKYNISIKSIKSFFNYPDVGLLGQQVNFLGLTILEEKLRAIKYLAYPKTLNVLKSYLGLTGYLCNYIHFYTQLAAPLQALKISLLHNTLVSGHSPMTSLCFKNKTMTPLLPRSTPCFKAFRGL